MVSRKWQMMGAGVVALLGALYMMEMTPSEEDLVDIGGTKVLMITQCPRVFSYVGDLSNYAMWFPGIENMTGVRPGPMQTGKEFEEVTKYPVYGTMARDIFVINYTPPRVLQFLYRDMSQVVITLEMSQQTQDKCLLEYTASTRRTSYLYHMTAGIPLRIMYAMRGRHAMFAIRAMFNDQGQ